MQFGYAQSDITPSKPIPIAGQMHVRMGNYTHDPLTVNAVAMSSGDIRVVLVSCDLLIMPGELANNVQAECQKAYGIPARSVIIGSIHTHLAPFTEDWLGISDCDPNYIEELQAKLVKTVGRALNDLEEVEVYAGAGYLEQMGFNRRGLHHGGKCDMYHGSWLDGFEGVEGPRDGEVGVVFAKRPDGSVKVVISSFSTHPNSVEGESFYSADLAGSVRMFIRRNLGEDVGVVYLTGAAGNTAPSKLDDNKDRKMPWRGEEGWKRSGLYLGGEIVKIISGAVEPMQNPSLRLEQATVPIAIREWPKNLNPAGMPGGFREYYTKMLAEWPRILAEESPADVRLNVVRVGDAAICTTPAELFVEHGLAMKNKSKAKVTLLSELTDGYVGYVPTKDAFLHGGYETWPAISSLLKENAGEIIVENIGTLLNRAFSDKDR
jgi:neutral ceramidase